jgi:F-type H+-transporting ATPase subunit b
MSIDWTVLVQMANFLILMLVLNAIFYKPIKKIMDSRKELIDSLKDNAEVAKTFLENGQAQQERFRIEVLREGVRLQNGLKEEGRAKETAILEETQKNAAERIDLARQAMEVQVAKVREELKAEAQVLANQLVNKLLGREAEPEH